MREITGGDLQSYKELEVWQRSRKLVKEVYLLLKKFPDEEKYSLTYQIKRSVISLPSTIAEGSGRNSREDFYGYLEKSSSKLYELETLLLLAYDLEFLYRNEFEEMSSEIREIQKLINTFINKLRTDDE